MTAGRKLQNMNKIHLSLIQVLVFLKFKQKILLTQITIRKRPHYFWAKFGIIRS